MNVMSGKKRIGDIISKYAILIFLVLLCVFFSIKSPAFLSMTNLLNILRQVAVFGMASVGMTFVILTGGIDLSVGSVIGLSSVMTAALIINLNVPVIPAILISIVISTLVGIITGLIITRINITPFIATLGMMTALRGVAFTITHGVPIFGFPKSFVGLGQGYIGIIPIPVVVMAIVFIFGWLILAKTRYGRYIYGIGGNEEAARLSGVNVKRVRTIAYGISAFLCGLAGVVLVARVNSGSPKLGNGYELEIITAVVLGGVSMTGGEGKISFVVVGVIIMGVLSNGMILIDMQEYTQWIVKGIVLLFAVGFDSFMYNRSRQVFAVTQGKD